MAWLLMTNDGISVLGVLVISLALLQIGRHSVLMDGSRPPVWRLGLGREKVRHIR